jgi:hypothetical protein
MILLLFKLLVGHALCDYPLQGDFMAKFKSRMQPFPETIWPWLLLQHAMIHAGAVYYITGSGWLAAVEFLHHTICDYTKSMAWITFWQDQLSHCCLKVIFAIILWL